MAGTSPPAGLLDRAGRVFSLAWQLARAFTDEYERQGSGFRVVDPAGWDRHKPAFEEFCAAVLDLRDEMQNPPDGFESIAEALRQAAQTAKQIRDTMRTADGQNGQSFVEFRFHLNSVVAAGNEGIDRIRKALRADDPFAFLSQPATSAPGDINTTPTLPPVPRDLIGGAARCIPEVLADVEPRPGGAAELVAAVLAKRVLERGHLLAAAHWAIHEAVRAGRLTAGRAVVHLPQVIGPGSRGLPARFFGTQAQRTPLGADLPKTGAMPIPKGKPTPFDNFKVMATPALWEWWTAQTASATKPAQPVESRADGTNERVGAGQRVPAISGAPGELPTTKVPGVVSLNVLRAHLEMTAFPEWRQRLESWPEVPYLRLHCARLFIGQPFASATIELLIAWFQKIGLTPEQARHLPLADAVRMLDAAQPPEFAPPSEAAPAEPQQNERSKPVAPKRSTERGEGRAKLTAALTKHHVYAEGGSLNLEPVGNNELARLAGVSESTASAFFHDQFQGHSKYRRLCQDAGKLVAALKLLNGEFAPHNLYGGAPREDGGD